MRSYFHGLARYGDDLAESTGWGKLWVGTLLVGIATSLPEVSVNVSAVWLENNPGLALGNVFGADMLNVFVLGSAALVAQHLNALIGSGDGELDSSAVVKVVERMSGTR